MDRNGGPLRAQQLRLSFFCKPKGHTLDERANCQASSRSDFCVGMIVALTTI